MTDNVFRIPIVAVDQATAVVRRVNASFGKFTKPIGELKKSVANLGKEAGFARLGKSAASAASAAGAVAQQTSRIVAPLAAIAGIGAAASIVEMTQAWVSQGAEIARTSRIIGVYQGDLQSMRAVARGFGVDAGTVSSSLNEMGNTVQGALYGRSQDALAMLGRLGVGVRRLKDGSIDAISMMKEVSDSAGFQKGNAQVKQLIASTLGLSGMLPVMLQGSAGIERYQKDMERLGAVQTPQAIAAAESFAQSQSRLGIAFNGVRNRIVSGLMPVFQPIIDHTTEWIAANRELIGTKIDYYGRRIADAVNSINWTRVTDDIHSAVSAVKSVVGFLGGWENAAIAVAGVMSIGLVSSLAVAGRAIIMFSAAIVANPIAAGIIAIVAGIAFAAYEIYKHWGGIKAFFVGIWDGVAGVFESGWKRIKPIVDWLTDSVVGKFLIQKFGAAQNLGVQILQQTPAAISGGRSAGTAPAAANSNAPAANSNDRAGQAVAYMQAKGWTHEQAAGLVAGFTRESQLNPGAVGDGGQAIGIGQWHKDRAAAITAHFGKPISAMNVNEQLDAADYELREGSEQKAGRAIAGTNSAAAAGAAASLLYERPANASGEANARSALAVNMFQGTQDMPGPYKTLAGQAANQNSDDGGVGAGGATVIEVRFSGAPAGMTATAKGPNADRITLRVEHSMPLSAVS